MKNKNPVANTHHNNQPQNSKKFSKIKLGVDVHADSYVVVRQIDSATPQPAQKMSPAKFLEFADKQLELAQEVHSCYEAGPFGYNLHRELLKRGIKNVVVRPKDWDEFGNQVKTDRTDALALVQHLDRYVQGNQKALAVIRVPTLEEEQQRALSRHREQLQKDRQCHEAQGRSLMLYLGLRIKGQWWKERFWEIIKPQLSAGYAPILENLRKLILESDRLLEEMTRNVQKQAQSQPKGFGELTSQILSNEVLDWKRFTNRRQVASLTGMCPSVRASGNSSLQGAITKHGNPRIRRALVELAWRVVRYQPNYPPVVHWKSVLEDKKAGGRKKKAIVAIGRHLAIDLWRMATGRATPEKLHMALNKQVLDTKE
jgi:transposase